MAIRIKVAQSAQELSDVYKLRHQVYVEGEGYFKDVPGELIVDQFDAIPNMANIIAYSGTTPVGTMRINCDSEILLPSDETYDFSEYRARVTKEAQEQGLPTPVIGSAGMLAIAAPWRNRRDVFRALFKMACDVGSLWGTTHIIATINVKSSGIYHKLGYETLSEHVWVPSIGEHIVAMASNFKPIYDWAFGAFADNIELLKSFAGSFQYLLVDMNSHICVEGEPGNEAYVISKGIVKVLQTDITTGKSLKMATLSRGDMFGELSLIDDKPRSATTLAVSNVELMVLSRDAFWQKTHQDPVYLKGLLQILTKRLRDIDQRAFVYAHGSVDVRLSFFINKVLETAVPSIKTPNKWIAKTTLEEFAFKASATIYEAKTYLDSLTDQGRLKVTTRDFIFYGDESI